GGGAGHVDLHVLHRVRWLEREATRVEGYALADESDLFLRGGFRFGLVGQMDEARLLVGTLGDGEVHAHPELLALLRAEDFDLEARLFGDALRDLRHFLRRHFAGWLIDEIARLGDAGCDDLAARGAAAERVEACFGGLAE